MIPGPRPQRRVKRGAKGPLPPAAKFENIS